MISNERLREMISPTWRFVGKEYREAVNELLWRRSGLGHKPLTVGTTTKYPDMPSDAWDKLREERDALVAELKRESDGRHQDNLMHWSIERQLLDRISKLEQAQ